MQPLLTTHDKRAESFRLIGQVGPLHRPRRLPDLEPDGVVLKEVGDDGGLDREIHVLRDIAGVPDLARKFNFDETTPMRLPFLSRSGPPEAPGWTGAEI